MNLRVELNGAAEQLESFGPQLERSERFWLRDFLSSQRQAALRIASQDLRHRYGERIIQEGESAHSVYCLVKGIVRISRIGVTGKLQIFAFKTPGDIFGIPEEGRYVNSVKALSAVTLSRIPWAAFKELLRRNSEIRTRLYSLMVSDLHQAHRHILGLGQQNAAQRLATFLLDMADHPDFYNPRRRQLALQINRIDLADYLGTTAENVSRTFTKLEHQALIRRISSRLIELRDMDGLRQLTNGGRRA